MRVPSIFRNGSGSRELAVNEPGRVTGQSAPSSSTVAAAAKLAVALRAIAATVPAIASSATNSTTTVVRT